LEDNFGTRPHSKVVSQVFPENCALRIHKKFSGPRDVLAILASFCMQQAIAANDLRFRIGKQRVVKSAGLNELVRHFNRIDADGGDFYAELMKSIQIPLYSPQLGDAERSPLSAVENQQDRAVAFQELGKSNLAPVHTCEREIRRCLANTWRIVRTRDVFRRNEYSIAE
jgi:hypothetical protein